MAPRRSVKISAPVGKNHIIPDKVTKGRTKKGKSLKVPSVITISVPVKGNSSDENAQLSKAPIEIKINNSLTPRRGRSKLETVSENVSGHVTTVVGNILDTERKVDLKTKIALADEVARSQLLKEPIEARVKPTPPAPRRGRSKPDILSEFFINTDTTPTVKVRGRKPLSVPKKTAKNPAQTTTMKTGFTRKRKADSTEGKPGTKRRNEPKVVKKEQNEVDPSVETLSKDDITRNAQNEPVTKLFNPPMVVIPTRRRRLWRGKKNGDISQTKTLGCSQLSTELVNPQTECTNLLKSEVIYCKSPILQASNSIKPIQNSIKAKDKVRQSSRQTSISSISNLSWTHDISSSSTTTSITVSSKDFIRFDNKMPVVKLRNIKNEIEKREPTNKAKTIISSEISSTDIETSCDQQSLIDSNSLPKLDPINLSSSSNNSINTKIRDHNIECNKKDYTEAAKNLERALERIDMEFINWIPDSDYVSQNFNTLKEKLFHILKSEFCALAHCRILQKISTNSNYSADDNIMDQSSIKNKFEVVTKSDNGNNLTVDDNGIKNNIVDTFTKKTLSEKNKISCDKNRNESKIQAIQIKKHSSEGKLGAEEAKSKPCDSHSDKVSDRDSSSNSDDSSSDSDDSSVDDDVKSFTPHSPPDDDDALSLFAESITGIESSKQNASTCSASKRIEEYIPEPVQKIYVSPNYTYCPTKIGDQVRVGVTKTICEKQNADSTSIYRETNSNSPKCNETISNSAGYGQLSVRNSPIYKEANNHSPVYKEANSNVPTETEANSILPVVKEANNILPVDKEANSISLIVEEANSVMRMYQESANETVNEKFVSEEHAPNSRRLIADMYKLRHRSMNIIFKGICYFNLLQNCVNTKNNKMCRYSHHIPDPKEITNKLCMLSDELLIKEYMLVRRHEIIINRYGICFAKVCAERRLTRILVEMALDCIKASHVDESLKVVVVEMTLMHLNNVDLSECEDLLKVNTNNGMLLCEVFMQVLTSSQNFSRFKPVFLSLTYFIVSNDRTFSLEVAEQILERVCIFPFDETLVRALLQIFRLTSREIFLNSRIVQFEKQISVNSDILEEYVSLKKDINFGNTGRWVENRALLPIVPISPAQPVVRQLFQTMPQPVLVPSEEQPVSELRENVALPPSPDTTHLENVNKAPDDMVIPKITRTISGLNITPYKQKVGYSPGTSKSEGVTPSPKYQNWRNKSILHHIAGTHTRSMRPPLRLRMSTHRKSNRWHDQRLVTLGGSPTTYLPPGSNY